MIAILLASAIIDPGRLKMTVGILAEPGVLVCRRKGDRVQPLDGVAVGDALVAVVIGPVTALPLARVARLGVAAMPQHDPLRFPRLIVAHKRAGRGPVPATGEVLMQSLSKARILIVATDGFEEWELFGPRQILQQRGAEVVLASLKLDPIQATVHDDPGKTIRPDLTVEDASADDFDVLILPGGVRKPDQLRLHRNVIDLIKAFDRQGKPIGAICHGPWLLVEADLLRGRTATSWPSIRTDLSNAGANVVDQSAVTDGNVVTSRNPDDVEAFTDALITLIENAPEVSEIRHPSELPA